jgi:hypothetical protein
MAKVSLKAVQDAVVESQIWKSIFRHGYTMNRRNRLLAVTNNVFFHILPTKISKYGMRMRFHWGAGIITFYLFLVLTFTGVLLMFYYTPMVPRAYYDMKDLQFVVPFGNILRNMHRYGAHAMVFMVMVHMARTFYTSAYKPPREFNWAGGYFAGIHISLKLQWLPAAMGSAGHLGCHCRHQYGPGYASPRA